jgi:hypothetical protein
VCAAVALPDGGECDGFHLSLRADLNDEIRIEADRQETTWASIYVRLRGGGLPGPDSVAIPPGSTIVANCELQSASGLRLKPP